ncbi:MAG: lipid-A-disaccharide synthase [Bacteroidetes bacterium]|nr:MAG: lipid-A-disaccharide synthase [Bacteroidota bacterium]
MKYYLLAGEASGDLHGALLIQGLKREDPDARIRFWGGERMAEAAGCPPRKHIRELAFMGFLEVVKNLPAIRRNFEFAKMELIEWRPDVLILIDYPGFNLRMARWAARHGIRVFYYISPQLWAWHSSRVQVIRRYVERMYVILPFEPAFYARHGVEVDYVGHPLLDVVDGVKPQADFRQRHGLDERPIIALLPGSRKQEIARMLPPMAALAPEFPGFQFVVGAAPAVEADFYHSLLGGREKEVRLVEGLTHPLLRHAHAALVTSGTATLETALFGVPQVVCYRGNALSFWLAKRLVQVNYISLVNLICEEAVVEELIQGDFNPEGLRTALQSLLEPHTRTRILEKYALLRRRLEPPGAAARAARLMVQRLTSAKEVKTESGKES